MSSELVVVVPARNEAERIAGCLSSLAGQSGVSLSVMVSDNASTDATAEIAHSYGDRQPIVVRSVEAMGPAAHFVSSIRWALESSQGDYYALLAGDDSWEPGFAAAAVGQLKARPEVGVVFPTFVWQDGTTSRRLAPAAFVRGPAWLRRLRALVLPDRRELSNLVYGVYRRDAFADLATAWAKGGDEYGADFAAAWSVVGTHQVLASPDAVGNRAVRADADLLERIGHRRSAARSPLGTVRLYVAVNVDVNKALAGSLRRVSSKPGQPATWLVQVLRAPQWCWGAVHQVRAVLGARSGQ